MIKMLRKRWEVVEDEIVGIVRGGGREDFCDRRVEELFRFCCLVGSFFRIFFSWSFF